MYACVGVGDRSIALVHRPCAFKLLNLSVLSCVGQSVEKHMLLTQITLTIPFNQSQHYRIQEHELLTQISTLESHLTVQYKANSDEEFVVSG